MSRLPANVSRFTFEIIASDLTFNVLAFNGREGLSELFEYRIEVLSPRGDLDLRELLGNTALLTLVHPQFPRIVHGMIASAAQTALVGQQFIYEFTLAPQLFSLTKRSGFRFFQELTVPQIVTQVLQGAGFAGDDYRWDIHGPVTARSYCVQYGESEFAFIARLLAEEGIHFHFAHSLNGHCLILADHNGVFAEIPGDPVLRYCQEDRAARDHAIIRQLHHQRRVTVNQVNIADYSAVKPKLALRTANPFRQAAEEGYGELEAYHYRPAHGQSEAEQEPMRQRLQQSHLCQADTISLASGDIRLHAGARFSVKEHPQQTLNRPYVLLSCQIEGKQPQSAEVLSHSGTSEFSCHGTALPETAVYRPPLGAAPAKVRGVQTAFVTGPVNNELYTDRHGRIKVQFHWDREGQGDEKTSCWVRVSQAIAGKEWGAFALPRVGQEVIVTFEEGDPARPLVTGCLYNSVNLPPYPLPAQKSRSGIKTRSAERGDGFNELRVEDRKGQEQLFLRAERNLDMRVGHRWQQWVKGNVHHQVQGNSYTSVAADEHLAVQGDLVQQTGQNLSFACGEDMHLKVSGAQVTQVANQLHIKGGNRLVIQAGQSLSVKVGGSFVTLDPSGVAIVGPLVRINEGGVGGGSARSASPQAPRKPAPPDDHNSGKGAGPADAEPPHDWKGLTFQRGGASHFTLEAAARYQAPFVSLSADSSDHQIPASLTQARKNLLSETFADWAAWQDDTLLTFDEVGEDPDTPELIRFAVAALKTPAKLGTGLVSGAASLGQLLTDSNAREQLVNGIVALYENPEKIADAAEQFVNQPGHEIVSDLFAFGGEMMVGGGRWVKQVSCKKQCPIRWIARWQKKPMVLMTAFTRRRRVTRCMKRACGVRVLVRSCMIPSAIRIMQWQKWMRRQSLR